MSDRPECFEKPRLGVPRCARSALTLSHFRLRSCKGLWQPARGQYGESGTARQPVNLEVVIESDDAGDPLAFGRADERGIGEIHRQVAVLLHQLFHACQIGCVQRDQVQGSIGHHVAQGVRPAWRVGEQVHGLGQRRPDCGKGTTNCFQRVDTSRVCRVVSVQEGDQRARVNEDVGHGAFVGADLGT